MRKGKTLTAATLAALMASTSVASAGSLGNGEVFSADTSNTVVNMSAEEMAATQGDAIISGTVAAISGCAASTVCAGAVGVVVGGAIVWAT